MQDPEDESRWWGYRKISLWIVLRTIIAKSTCCIRFVLAAVWHSEFFEQLAIHAGYILSWDDIPVEEWNWLIRVGRWVTCLRFGRYFVKW